MSKIILIIPAFIFLLLSGCENKDDIQKKHVAESSLKTYELTSKLNLEKLIFTGMIGTKTGLYEYDFTTKSYSEFWQNTSEEVVELSYSPDANSAFFLTAHQRGKRGVFPFIDEVKLYFINLDSWKVRFRENIGSGLQVFSTWENENSFKITLNVMDVTVGKYVEQSIKTYNSLGEKLSDKKREYELAKEGYPHVPVKQIKMDSPDKKFSVNFFDSALTQVYLTDYAKNKVRTEITRQNQKINRIGWSDNGRFLILSTLDITPMNETLYDPEPQTSKLFIYSLETKKIMKMFDGGGVKDLMLNGNLLIFDDGFSKKSKIFIYNFNSTQIVDTINIDGGCGLKSIPSIPNYEA